MSLAIGAIRTAIAEILEGALGTIHPAAGTFQRGAFDGQPDDAKLSRLRQTSTATHWFDVTVGEHDNHASSPLSARHGHRRLTALPITVDIWSGLGTEAQESDRGTLLATIASDCEDARQALGYPGSLAETADEIETGIIGGLMRGPAYTGLPEWERVDEDWGKRWLHSQISGMLVCAEIEDPRSILGSMLHTWLAPDRARDFATVTNGAETDITTWRNRGRSGDAVEFSSAGRPVYDSTGINGLPSVARDDSEAWQFSIDPMSIIFETGDRPYFWTVCVLSDASGVSSNILLSAESTDGSTCTIVNASPGLDAFTAALRCTDGTETIVGPALDTDPHLIEVGFLLTTASKLVVDGVGYDGTRTGGIEEDYDHLRVGFFNVNGAWTGSVSEIVVSIGLPSFDQVLAMRGYFERKYGIDVSGVDEGGAEDFGQLDFSDPNQSGWVPLI